MSLETEAETKADLLAQLAHAENRASEAEQRAKTLQEKEKQEGGEREAQDKLKRRLSRSAPSFSESKERNATGRKEPSKNSFMLGQPAGDESVAEESRALAQQCEVRSITNLVHNFTFGPGSG